MSNRGRYLGGGLSLVDDKGRATIPACLRGTLLGNAGLGTSGSGGKTGGQVFVGAHQQARCLVAFDSGYVDRLADDLDRREREHAADDGEFDYNIKRRGGLGAEATPFDASGRFVLPGFPRFHAGIEGHAFFWGSLDYIEIWNPATLLETEGLPPVMVSACQYHLADRKVVL